MGRPMFTREEVQADLYKFGWELPDGILYTGQLDPHAVRCVKCGWVQMKHLHMLKARGETCSMCGEYVTSEDLDVTLNALDRLTVATNKNTDAVTALTAVGVQFLEDMQKRRVDTIEVLPDVPAPTSQIKALFKKLIAKGGYRKYGRKMMSDEWHNLSHELADSLLMELAEDQSEYSRWEALYTDILSDNPVKQGQDIMPAVVPVKRHGELLDAMTKRFVKL